MANKTGLETLKEAVIKDTKEGQDCFNEKGCDQKNACSQRYCDKYAWVIERAKHYAEFCKLSLQDVLNEWEADRGYWYLNYYQDSNQPLLNDPVNSNAKIIPIDDWADQAIKLYGGNKNHWQFVCPACGHVQIGQDFLAHDAEPQNAYLNCIGRYNNKKVGCDWSLGGLFSIHKTAVLKNAKVYPVFEFNLKGAEHGKD